MSQGNESIHDSQGPAPSHPDDGCGQEHAGSSGEGAASALAQLKTQARQQRRQSSGDDHAERPVP